MEDLHLCFILCSPCFLSRKPLRSDKQHTYSTPDIPQTLAPLDKEVVEFIKLKVQTTANLTPLTTRLSAKSHSWFPGSHHPVQTELHGVKAGVLCTVLAPEVLHCVSQLQDSRYVNMRVNGRRIKTQTHTKSFMRHWRHKTGMYSTLYSTINAIIFSAYNPWD